MPKLQRTAVPRLLQSPDLKRLPWLVHGFTTRPGGVTTSYGGRTLNLGFTKDDERERVSGIANKCCWPPALLPKASRGR